MEVPAFQRMFFEFPPLTFSLLVNKGGEKEANSWEQVTLLGLMLCFSQLTLLSRSPVYQQAERLGGVFWILFLHLQPQ